MRFERVPMQSEQSGQPATVDQDRLLLRLSGEPAPDQRQLLGQRLPEGELQGEQLWQQKLERRQSEGRKSSCFTISKATRQKQNANPSQS